MKAKLLKKLRRTIQLQERNDVYRVEVHNVDNCSFLTMWMPKEEALECRRRQILRIAQKYGKTK